MFVMVMGLSIGCERSLSVSSKPVFFVVQKMRQDYWDKQTNVARYKLSEWTTTASGTPFRWDSHWYTLQDDIQVGDTLIFIKK